MAASNQRLIADMQHIIKLYAVWQPRIVDPAADLQHFLAAERQSAASVGYDRPSPKLLAFLRKHYGKR